MTRPRKRQRTESDNLNSDTYTTPPSQEEWGKMRSYRSFSIVGSDRMKHDFYIGDHVFVLPDGASKDIDHPQEDLWVAKIDCIRASDPKNAWMRVQWYYSAKELHQRFPEFPLHLCGTRERVQSNHYDIIPTISCSGKTDVVRFLENDVPDEEIDPSCLYYRLTFDVRHAAKKKRSKCPTFRNSCICQDGYGPEQHIMHWCSQCHRWLHQHCLSSSSERRDTSESSSTTVVFEDSQLKKRTRKFEHDAAVLQLIQSVARYPVVRGCQYGLVGNAQYVTNARNMLRDVQEAQDVVIPKDWERLIGGGQVEHIVLPCPVCRNLI